MEEPVAELGTQTDVTSAGMEATREELDRCHQDNSKCKNSC